MGIQCFSDVFIINEASLTSFVFTKEVLYLFNLFGQYQGGFILIQPLWSIPRRFYTYSTSLVYTKEVLYLFNLFGLYQGGFILIQPLWSIPRRFYTYSTSMVYTKEVS